MLRFQIALAILFVGCIAFVACQRGQQMLDPAEIIDTSDDMTLSIPMDYMSWMHVMLDAPVPMADATSPAETGAAHTPPMRLRVLRPPGPPTSTLLVSWRTRKGRCTPLGP